MYTLQTILDMNNRPSDEHRFFRERLGYIVEERCCGLNVSEQLYHEGKPILNGDRVLVFANRYVGILDGLVWTLYNEQLRKIACGERIGAYRDGSYCVRSGAHQRLYHRHGVYEGSLLNSFYDYCAVKRKSDDKWSLFFKKKLLTKADGVYYGGPGDCIARVGGYASFDGEEADSPLIPGTRILYRNGQEIDRGLFIKMCGRDYVVTDDWKKPKRACRNGKMFQVADPDWSVQELFPNHYFSAYYQGKICEPNHIRLYLDEKTFVSGIAVDAYENGDYAVQDCRNNWRLFNRNQEQIGDVYQNVKEVGHGVYDLTNHCGRHTLVRNGRASATGYAVRFYNQNFYAVLKRDDWQLYRNGRFCLRTKREPVFDAKADAFILQQDGFVFIVPTIERDYNKLRAELRQNAGTGNASTQNFMNQYETFLNMMVLDNLFPSAQKLKHHQQSVMWSVSQKVR